jgi:hypothetical protein
MGMDKNLTPQKKISLVRAVDRAFAVVTGARNLARPVLIRQELSARFLESSH